MALASGARLGVYEVIALVGRGGMGEVYRARDTKLERDVALKILPEAIARDGTRALRFSREARLLASLNHPHIATIHGVEDSTGVVALVMELVDGDTLTARLSGRKAPLPTGDALVIARQIAEALEAAHDKGIAHRDLKPGNVMVTRAGLVKVLDFGLAKSIGADGEGRDSGADAKTMTAVTQFGAVIGTAAYMSPEQARGYASDQRSDIWAFGCVLFEMLAGHAPFTGATASDILAAVLEREPAWQDLPNKLPQSITRLLHRCLEKEPARRLRDISAARMDIEDAIPGSPDAGLTSRRSGGPGVATSTRVVWVSACAAIALAAIAVWRLRTAPPIPAVTSTADVTVRQLTNYGRLETNAALSPDGRTFAFESAHGGTPDIWLRQVSGGEPVRLTNDAANELDLAFSPDGERIYFTQSEGGSQSVWRIGVLGGQPQLVIANAHGAVPSSDGRKLAFLVPEGPGSFAETLQVSDVEGNHAKTVAQRIPNFPRVRPAWSTDSTRLSYVRAGLFAPMNLFITDLTSGREQQVTHFTRPAQGVGMHAWLPRDTSMIVTYSADSRAQAQLDLGVLSIAGGSIRRITATVGQTFETPTVSADGSRLIVTATDSTREIWKFPITGDADASGRAGTRIVDNAQQPMWSFVTRDGRTLLFNGIASGSRNLWLGLLDGQGKFRQITSIDNDAIGHSSLSPDGTRVAFVSFAGGNSDIWVQNVDGSGLRQLTHDAASDSWPVWAPGGDRIVYSSSTGSMQSTRVLDLQGGNERLIDGFFRGDWIRNPNGTGSLIVTSATPLGVRLIDPDTRRVLWERPTPGTFFSLPVFSADGRRITLVAQNDRVASVVHVFDAATGQSRIVAQLPFSVIFRASWVDGDRAVIVNRVENSSHIAMFEHFQTER